MIEKESSIAAGIRGIQMPGGERKRQKNLIKMSKPFEELDPDFKKFAVEKITAKAEIGDAQIINAIESLINNGGENISIKMIRAELKKSSLNVGILLRRKRRGKV